MKEQRYKVAILQFVSSIAVLCLFCTSWLSPGFADAKNKELTTGEATNKAMIFLASNTLVLTVRGFSSWGSSIGSGKKCYHIEGPGKEGLSVDVDTSSGHICAFQWSRLAVDSQAVLFSQDQAEKQAQNFLVRACLHNCKTPLDKRVFIGQENIIHGTTVMMTVEMNEDRALDVTNGRLKSKLFGCEDRL